MRTLLLYQISAVFLAAGIGYLLAGQTTAFAALCGGAIAIANTLLLAWRHARAACMPADQAHRQLRQAYWSSLERLVLVGALFAAAIGVFKLAPLPLLGAFIVGQLVLLIFGIKRGI